MKILLTIGHPAHVHLYKNFYFEMKNKGHNICVVVKNIKSALDLLKIYNIPFINLGNKKDSNVLKGLYQLKYNLLVYRIVKKNNIDVGVGSSITLTHVSRLTKMKSIITNDDDDDVDKLFSKFANPFADVVLTPDVLKNKRKGKNCIFYSGYHELAYLHPNRFSPNKDILEELSIREDETFFMMRFNAFKASHDIGVNGLSLEQKLELINVLEPFGKIFITTEREIEPELKKYQLKISSEKIHSLMYYSTLFVGDSQTMCSEAAVLGVPSIRCNSLVGKISYLEEEEKKYGLTYGFKPENFNIMIKKIDSLLKVDNLKLDWKVKRDKMIREKIDVSSFFVWFIENYPKSFGMINQNPSFQKRFI